MLFSKLISLSKRAFNVNFVPLIASSPISKQIACKIRLAIREHHCTRKESRVNGKVEFKSKVTIPIFIITFGIIGIKYSTSSLSN